ncbi:MAG TPA: adenosylcobinamide-GDP ribazoletransferase [Desulfurivibrionaceae bacterium]|nr:adenosylcobinamide-GDP ribazoletransferase [Desulfurivibrionaceae bacterium]
MNSFLAALRFLTILPIPGQRGHAPADLRRSLWSFPLVGLLLGGLTAALFWLVGPFLPKPILAVLAVATLLAWSGGLHLDGIADCADGFFSSRPRERMLEIMRDSRIGAMGVIGLVLVLALKMAALYSLPASQFWQVLLLMPLAGRVGILLMLAVLPYARPEGGLATVFFSGSRRLALLPGLVLLALVAWLLAKSLGLFSVLDTLILLLPFCLFCYAKIGGATGDTLGAACEIAETLTAVCFATLLNS